MKRIEYTSNLVRTFLAVAFAGMMSACTLEHLEQGVDLGTDGGLAINSTVSDAVVATKAESVEALKEKQLNTLDVFVEDVAAPGSFIRQYHLPYSGGQAVQEKVNNWLADNWKGEGLVVGKNYNIYVATNNTKTKANVANVADLKALTYNEVDEGIAVIKDGNIDWIENSTSGNKSTSGNIYKLYDANPGSARALTSDKEFMMDGVIKNWTPDPNTRDQVFPVTINRAAAKFVLNVKFDADFLKSLTHKKVGDEWVEKDDAEKVSISGSPAWKFYNFAFGAPVFAPDTQGQGVEVHNSNFNIFHNQEYAGDDKHFTITTYSYPNKWASADYATAAPSLVISVGYLDNGATDPNYHYYRIPLVKSTVTEIMRNHIYVVNATIATRGSAAQEDQDVTEDINYAVLPWNDETNSAAIHNEVESVQHLYLKVDPNVYTLRGDNNQSVTINYLKATGTQVKWKLFAINPTTGDKGNAVESTASNAVWGWFYDKNGDMKTSYSNWTHMKVDIVQSDEGTSDSKGTITVTSTALDNRAIKYMLLRVYLEESPTLYEDVLIRHFPTDNIQSFTGSWSSYHTGTSSREDTWDPVAAGWEEGTYASEEVEVRATDPYDRVGTKYVVYSTNRNTFRGAVPATQRGTIFDSQSNSYHATDGYDYWGTPSSTSIYDYEARRNNNDRSNNYDYWIYQSSGGYYSRYYYYYYNYNNYSRGREETAYYRTRYYREVIVDNPETGNWVDWDRDHNKSGTTKWVERSDDNLYNDTRFHAHVWDASDGRVREINSSNNNMASLGNTTGEHYNNHMYVVQISATSNKYVLGKPILGNPDANRSMDEVVSPAFMIASQLGVVSTGWNSASAAEHCRRYLEVGTDGYRYAGWRLPTDDEIKIISEYQMGRFGNITIPENDRVMDYVLKGANYFNLSGGTTPSNYTTGNSNYLRCVRDLSAAEIENLNGFEAMIQRYQAN